jgi:hypothetical protein
MTRFTSSTIIASIGIIACFGLASAQTTPTQADEKTKMRDRAFALLESVADEIGTLQSAENRARLGSNVAGSLWNHDERRARVLLVAVQNDINAGLQNVDDDDANAQTRMVFFHLRVDTVERIARYDPNLALDFFKATEPASEVKLPYQFAEMQRQLEMRLAQQIAADSPEVALKIARRTLKNGFSYELHALLRQLNKKHKAEALLLYKEIVAKLRDTDFTEDDQGAFWFALQLAHMFKPPSVDAAAYRELINVFINIAVAKGCEKKSRGDDNSWMCYQIGSLLPEMESVEASRAAKLKQWAPEDDQETSPRDSAGYAELQFELDELPADASVDDILKLISKYPQMTAQIYFKAIEQALMRGDIDRARKIVTDYETEPQTRQYILSQIDAVEKRAKLNEANLPEIQQQLAEIPGAYQRAIMLMNYAGQMGGTDRKSALKLLDQARGIIDSMKPGREQTDAQVNLAMMYCLEKSARGFDIMESLMPKLNDLVAGAVKLDGYENHYLRDGEWNMSSEGALGQLLTRLSQNAAYFSWCDLDRALSLAAQFERPELRLMAQMKLAQSIIAGPPKRNTMFGVAFNY